MFSILLLIVSTIFSEKVDFRVVLAIDTSEIRHVTKSLHMKALLQQHRCI